MTDALHSTRRPMGALLIVAVFVGLAGMSFSRLAVALDAPIALSPTQIDSLGIRTQVASSGTAPVSGRYPATVLIPSGQQRVVSAPLPGLVESLSVSVGDTVRAGQLLGVLRSAQAQELQHDVHVARSQAVLTGATLARDEQLYKEGLIATARLETTRSQASLAREQRAERELTLQQAGGTAAQEGGRLTLRAAISGVVLERPVFVGQRVEANSMLYRLAVLSPLWLEMQIPAREASIVHLGDAVTVASSTARARVIAIGHAVDTASQTILVRAELSGPLADLRPGQGVEAQLQGTTAGLVNLPSASLVEEGGKVAVFVEVAAGQFDGRPVTVVGNSGGTASVRGLPAGSKVVVQGMASLKALAAAKTP